jgi:hypothetical protein
MNSPRIWPGWHWPPWPGTDDPGRGGMSQLAAYEAGLTDDPGCWTQKIEVYWDARLNPASPEYDPQFADQVAWEEPNPEEARAMAEPHQAEPEAWPEPELPF